MKRLLEIASLWAFNVRMGYALWWWFAERYISRHHMRVDAIPTRSRLWPWRVWRAEIVPADHERAQSVTMDEALLIADAQWRRRPPNKP